MAMKSAWQYFLFWSFIGVYTLFVGIEVVDWTDFPASVSPASLFLLKVFFVTAVFYSSTYAFIIQPNYTRMCRRCVMRRCLTGHIISFAISQLPFIVGKYLSLFDWIIHDPENYSPDHAALVFTSILLNYMLWSMILCMCNPQEEDTGMFFHYGMMSVLHLFMARTPYLRAAVLFSSLCSLLVTCRGDPLLRRWLPENVTLIRMMKRNGEWMKCSIGMLGTILFQCFFRLTSFGQLVPFICFTLAWLASLALLLCPNDLGVFNFLLGNVVLNYSVNEYRLHATTWILYGFCIFLYFVRFKLLAEVGGDAAFAGGWDWGVEESLPETLLNVNACDHGAILKRDIVYARGSVVGCIIYLFTMSLMHLEGLLGIYLIDKSLES